MSQVGLYECICANAFRWKSMSLIPTTWTTPHLSSCGPNKTDRADQGETMTSRCLFWLAYSTQQMRDAA